MKTTIYFAVIVLISLSAIFTSCQKDEDVLLEKNLSLTAPDNEGPDSLTVEAVGDLKSSNYILNASSANNIPSKFFKVASKYKYSYQHLKQPTSNSCSWTNYVMCTGAIANVNGNYYPVNNNQVYLVRNRCNYSASIGALKNYARDYDYNKTDYELKYTDKSSSGRFQMIKYMLAHINDHHTPFIALAMDQSSGVGHYLTVWSINWKQGGTGSTIYYTNSLCYPSSSFDGNLKSVSFTTFLNWMQSNPSANKYNCLFLWED